MATQLREVATPAFKVYCQQVKANIAALAKALTAKGYRCVVLAARTSRVPWHSRACVRGCGSLASGGTENHLIVWDLRPLVRRLSMPSHNMGSAHSVAVLAGHHWQQDGEGV